MKKISPYLIDGFGIIAWWLCIYCETLECKKWMPTGTSYWIIQGCIVLISIMMYIRGTVSKEIKGLKDSERPSK